MRDTWDCRQNAPARDATHETWSYIKNNNNYKIIQMYKAIFIIDLNINQTQMITKNIEIS
jgi:hypothetical protein